MAVPELSQAGAQCMSDDELAGFVGGELERDVAHRIAAHIDTCARCRRLVSALAQAQDGAPATSVELTAGASLGRFTLIRPIGRGSMGEVWAARDSELDREVALKLLHLRAASLGADASVRLRREAQAMARLDHPNVVAIYELGADGDRVFCAMRLVDGVTLRAWLTTPRRWREVLGVAIAAGRGLAAAHAAGLVHRDIKPENILIARDGRALVTDFGLAKLADMRSVAHDAAAPGEPPGDALAIAETIEDSATLTRTGALVGTPAYMPPEHLAGERVDDKSDQFSFCVTMHEALFGMRPFQARTISELVAAIRRGPRRPGNARGVPGGIVRCLRRGLAADKAARWPSMSALLAELDRVLRRRRRRLVIATAAAVVAMSVAMFLVQRDDPREVVRTATETRIAAAWNPDKAARLRAAFRATGGAVADERAESTIRAFDGYRADWVRQRLDAWSATHVRGEQTAELLERRLACFDRLADALGELATLLVGATPAEVDRAPQLAFRLDPIASCAQVDRLMAISLAPSTPAGTQAERGLRELEALSRAGRQAEALERATALVEEARRAGDPTILARARFNLGSAQASSGKLEPAAATLRQAVQDAAVARDHYLVAESWLRLYSLTSFELAQPAAAAEIEPAVAAAVAQAGNDPRQLGDLAMTRGVAATAHGDFAIARDHFVEARDRHLAAHGPNHPIVANAEANLGATLIQLGQYDEATRELERAIAIIRGSLGERHPVIARAEQGLAAIAARRKDWASSEHHGRAALAINVIVRGADHRETAQNRIFLARALREQHRFDESRAELDRARDSLHRSLPATHPDAISLDLRYAELAEAEGHWAEAERLAKRSVDGLRETKAPALSLAFSLSELARMVAHRSPGDSLAIYDEALTLDAPRKGRSDAEDAEFLEEISRVALAARRPAFALGWFDRIPGGAAKLPKLRAELERARDQRK